MSTRTAWGIAVTHPELGALVRLDPRTVFQSEAQDFTPWLADNLDLLGTALGLEIELVEREMPVGRYSVDVYAKEVGSGRAIVIENQLEATDHGHLGQLLTYAAGLEAQVIVWITPEFRDEHRRALEWLNLNSAPDVSFFGIELELLRISDSPPAPNFKLVAQPSEWQKEVSADARHERTERQLAYHDFFDEFVRLLKSEHPGFTNVSRVGYESWTHFAAGRTGFSFSVAFTTGNRFRIELEIDTGDYSANRLAFEQLHDQKPLVEQELGEALTWDEVEHRRACRIFVDRAGTIDFSPELLSELKQWAMERLLKFKHVFGTRIRELDLESSGQGATP